MTQLIRPIFALFCGLFLAQGALALADDTPPTGPPVQVLPPSPPSAAPAVQIGVIVTSFTIDASGPLAAGNTVRATLTGSPGGKAFFSIPMVVDRVVMKETAPGTYVGDYQITDKTPEVVGASVFGDLTSKGGFEAPILCAKTPISVDHTAPKLVNRVPDEGDHLSGSPTILYCGYDDGLGVGVDLGRVQMQLDGVDITSKCQITPLAISYQPATPIPPGDHDLFVKAVDLAGNAVQDIWKFTIVPAQDSPIHSVKVDNALTLLAGDPLNITVNALPGAKVSAVLKPLHANIPLSEIQPGVYQGKFTPRAGDSVASAPLTISYAPSIGTKFFAEVDHPITVTAGKPEMPMITIPGPFDSYKGDFEAAGKAPAGLLVVCTVTYQTRSAGGALPFGGTLLTVSARANNKGEWKIDDMPVNVQALFDHDRDTRVKMTVVTVDAAGQQSEPNIVTLDFYP